MRVWGGEGGGGGNLTFVVMQNQMKDNLNLNFLF